MLAGEASGDRIGAALVHGLKAREDIELVGVGGDALAAEGLISLYPMDDLSVMGFADVFKRLPRLLWRLRQTRKAILRTRPDAVLLIDAQEFSARVAGGIRRAGFTGPVVLYVAPTVWAWRPERAPALKGVFDEILAVLPLEPRVMAELGGPPTTYVGHPALARTRMRETNPESGPIVLLPGSRRGELRRHMPLMRETVARLKDHSRVTGFVIPTLPRLEDEIRREVAEWPAAVDVVTDDGERVRVFGQALMAIATAGTITLELALSGVPMVVTYVGDRGQARHFAKAQAEAISLPNIVMNRRVVPEVLFLEPDPGRLASEALSLIDEASERTTQWHAFAELRRRMEEGEPSTPREDPADRVLAVLQGCEISAS